jgi:hypothetical protein
MLEMLVDPFGDRLMAGDSPKTDQGRVLFLVEVSDPSEANDYAYTVNGVLVSDFYTPHYFDPIAASSERYSFVGAIKRPRQVLPGGYLSWKDPISNDWWQEVWLDGASESKFRNLGKLTAQMGGFRAEIDRVTARETAKAIAGGREGATLAGLAEGDTGRATDKRAAALRRDISGLLAKGAPKPPDTDSGRRTTKRIRSGD